MLPGPLCVYAGPSTCLLAPVVSVKEHILILKPLFFPNSAVPVAWPFCLSRHMVVLWSPTCQTAVYQGPGVLQGKGQALKDGPATHV